ncbi:class I SAM-dependent methyltransferase [bacterium]|nr:class I SAM-dependent methyltransferase [bacterium]
MSGLGTLTLVHDDPMVQQDNDHVMPWWMGYLLINPLRRLSDPPELIVGPYIKPGNTVLDIGCAMGYFTLPMAKMVGQEGRVIATDIQPEMLVRLQKRVQRAKLGNRIDLRRSYDLSLGLADLPGQADFALAFAVLHEAVSKQAMLEQIYATLRPGGRLLIVEPPSKVNVSNWAKTEETAFRAGFILEEHPSIHGRIDRSMLLSKPAQSGKRA